MNKDCKRRLFRRINQDVVWILRTRGETTSKNLLLIHVLYGFVTKKSMKSEEDEMMLRMQEHHHTVSAKRTIGVEKGEVCEFLYLVKTVIALQQSQNLTRFQGFSFGTRLESDTLGPRVFSFPDPAASFGHVVFETKQIKPSGCQEKRSVVRCLAVRSESTMRIFVTHVNE